MFRHQFKYALLSIIKSKSILFWTILFPIALATFMYLSFGSLFEEEMFSRIPVAIVETKENEAFSKAMEELSDNEDALIKVVDTKDMAEAEKLLGDDSIVGIFYVEDEISLVVKENGIQQTILNEVLEQYEKYHQVIVETATNNPEALSAVLEALESELEFCKEESISSGNQDNVTTYFYAIFAMSCLFAGLAGIERTERMQANTSALGMRRCLAPHSKMITIGADFSAALIVQFLFEVVAFLYMSLVLNIDFGSKVPAIMVLLLMGCTIGISIGIIVGTIQGKTNDEKTSILSAITMVCSILADLVINGIRDLIEHTIPILNKINPASLIVDSFYALNVYDSYDRFLVNISILGGMALVLLVISYRLVRRVRYANL